MGSELYAWGNNNYGGIGDNSTVGKSSPVQTIAGGSNWANAAFGQYHSAGVKTDGTLWCWGQNYYGELGDNTTVHRSSPVQTITGGTDWSQVSCGPYHTAAVKKDGTLWLWGGGFNNAGQLGDNTIIHRSSPVQTIAGGSDWSSVSCGYKNTAAIKTDGTLWVWGWNAYGQVGDNTTNNISSPSQTVAFGTNWSKVSVGYSSCGAIKKDGTLWMWGANNVGQLGINLASNRSSPVQTITGGTDWSEISLNSLDVAAIKTDGTLWCWGFNFDGQVGDNTSGPGTYKSSPVQTITYGTNWSKISTGASIKLALKKDGTLWSWGANNYGELGDNTLGIPKSSPVQVIGASTSWSDVASRVFSTAGAIQTFVATATKVAVATNPSEIYNGQPFGTQPIINLVDNSDVLITTATNSVTASVVSGSLTIAGTTTVTASGGVAAFADLSFNGVGSASILFASSGLTSAIVGPLSALPPFPVMPIRSEVSGKIPVSGQLLTGELALNLTDQIGYVKKSDGSIIQICNGAEADGGVF